METLVYVTTLCFYLVPSANKRDTRSIEETLNDLRTKKAKLQSTTTD